MTTENLGRMVRHLGALCQADPRIVAAFVGGSLAAGTADRYSDVDAYLIVADEAYVGFLAEREAFMRQLGELVFLEHFDGFGFDMLLFIFADGVKGELALARASRFTHIHHGPYRTLVDKAGLLDGVAFAVDRASIEEQRQSLAGLLKSFWRGFLVMGQALGRGNLLSAATYLEQVRRELVTICRLSVDFHDAGGHPRLEAMLPPYLQEALADVYPPLEKKAMVRAARRMADLFPELARPLAARQGVDYPDALERVVRTWYDDEFGAFDRQAARGPGAGYAGPDRRGTLAAWDDVATFVRQNGNPLDRLRLRRALDEPFTAAEAETTLAPYQFPDGSWDYQAPGEEADRVGSLGGTIHCLRWLREFGLGDALMMAHTLAFLSSIQAADGSFYETEAKLAHSPQVWLQEDTLIDRFYFTAAVPMRLFSLGFAEHPIVEPAMRWLEHYWMDWELVTGTWYNLWALLCIHPERAEPSSAYCRRCYTTASDWLAELEAQPLTWLLDALHGAGFSRYDSLVARGIARLRALRNKDGTWSDPRHSPVETTISALWLLRGF